MSKRIICPSLLSANFAELGKDIEMLNRSSAEWIHFDVMDGVFVPNISFGIPVLKAIRPLTKKIIDAHLMIKKADSLIDAFADAGADVITVHVEACTHLNRTLNKIKERGLKAGVALNPHTPLSSIEEVIGLADMFLIMSVNPGFGAQKMVEGSFSKISRLRKMLDDKGFADTLIQVDGGVNTDNAAKLFDAGCNVLVAGNTVFSSKNPEQTILDLLESK